MLQLNEIEQKELPNLILLAYDGDQELLDKFHVEKFTLQEAVNSTLKMIDDVSKDLHLTYIKVMFGGVTIGYIIYSGKFLYSFGIAMSYRNKEVLKEWWDGVLELIGNDLTCGLLSNNERAIQYMLNRGMKIKWTNETSERIKEVLLTF